MGFKDWFKSKEIENKPFIKVGLYFGIDNRLDKEKVAEELFDSFNRLRLDPEKAIKLPNGINPPKTIDYFPAKDLYIPDGKGNLRPFPVPKEGYIRTKEFTLKKSKGEGYFFGRNEEGKLAYLKDKTNKVMISFLAKGDYSPKELAKDMAFITGGSNIILKTFKLEPLNIFEISKEDEEIFIRYRFDIVEFKYPLKDRIKLYKTNKELDLFIFDSELKELLNSKSLNGEEEIKKEAIKLLEEQK